MAHRGFATISNNTLQYFSKSVCYVCFLPPAIPASQPKCNIIQFLQHPLCPSSLPFAYMLYLESIIYLRKKQVKDILTFQGF